MNIAKHTAPVLTLLLLSASPGLADETIPRRDALSLATAVAADLKVLQDTPIPTDVDLKHPAGLRDGDAGVLVLPECKLTLGAVTNAGEKAVSIGQMWLHALAPVRDGRTVDRAQLRLVPVTLDEGEVTALQCTLGVQKSSTNGLELVLFGRDKTPLVKAPLKKIEARSSAPIELASAPSGSGDKSLTLKILGQYQATIVISDFFP